MARSQQNLQETREESPPEPLGWGWGPARTLISDFSPPNVREYVPLVISHLVSGNLWWQPRTLVQCPLLLTVQCGDLGSDFFFFFFKE